MRRILAFALGGIGCLAALIITLYPLLAAAYNDRHQSSVYTQYQEELSEIASDSKREAWNAAVAYNAQLAANALVDAHARSDAAGMYEDLLNPLGNGVMGYIVIDKIGVALPILHSTASESLEYGAGHMLGSSLPVGGIGTHCVLAAHSGVASQKLFSDLDQLEAGDCFRLEILGQTLVYQVDQINTVLPHESNYLYPDPELDLCTLVTCTPFGVNTHRLLVRGFRISDPEAQQESLPDAVEEAAPARLSTWTRQYIVGICGGLAAAAGLFGMLILLQRMRRQNHVQ